MTCVLWQTRILRQHIAVPKASEKRDLIKHVISLKVIWHAWPVWAEGHMAWLAGLGRSLDGIWHLVFLLFLSDNGHHSQNVSSVSSPCVARKHIQWITWCVRTPSVDSVSERSVDVIAKSRGTCLVTLKDEVLNYQANSKHLMNRRQKHPSFNPSDSYYRLSTSDHVILIRFQSVWQLLPPEQSRPRDPDQAQDKPQHRMKMKLENSRNSEAIFAFLNGVQ